MNVLKQYQEEGIQHMLNEAKVYVRNQPRVALYRWKSVMLDDSTVSINGVTLDMSSNILTEDTKRRIWLGKYEQEETELIKEHLHPNLPVIDIGAGIGYTTALIDMHTNESTTVIGLEANPNLLPMLQRTKELNNSDFIAENKAYDSHRDSVDISIAADHRASSTYKDQKTEQSVVNVPAESVEGLIKSYDFTEPLQLVVDIEGGEHNLIQNEAEILASACRKLIIEFHSFTELPEAQYVSALTKAGFTHVTSCGTTHLFESDPD